ncbi:hypothetical protein HGB24_02120 [Candidatus Saccharibacteria bacterium]|nr:hypothetical protein [Candidatus Saccharibacteria bacterium]
MKVTSITAQLRDKDRVNVSVDGKYLFSLDIAQLSDLGVKVGRDYDDFDIEKFKLESEFGKVYARTLEYCLVRPRSRREVMDYLRKKSRPIRKKNGQISPGVSNGITDRVMSRLIDRGYIDDQKFASFWVENRHQKKGISTYKLKFELRAKGIDNSIIESVLNDSERLDCDEIKKIIIKKQSRYPDKQKMATYLIRQGFRFDDIKESLDLGETED